MRAFNEMGLNVFTEQMRNSILSEIKAKGKDYILNIDEQEYQQYLHDKYSLEELVINKSSEIVAEPAVSYENVPNIYGNFYRREVYQFTVSYTFTGSAELFRVRPNPWTLASNEITINMAARTVSFSFVLYEQIPEQFHRAKEEGYRNAFTNLDKLNNNVREINSSLPLVIRNYFNGEKGKYLQQNKFYQAVNIKVNPGTSMIFTAPTIKKKIIPQPVVTKGKEFTSEPTMSTEMFTDIINIIYSSGKSMEKKPSLYKDKDEEGLRDQFLFVLETRYESTTATGETFNKGGKTDILLKFADGTNLFVAECKIWHGGTQFLDAISQLFDRYLTWRDSKVAIILFVKNKEFTSVLATIKKQITQHPYFVKEKPDNGESSFTYQFSLPQDKLKAVHVNIMAFHYP